jgi:hypothetical protein
MWRSNTCPRSPTRPRKGRAERVAVRPLGGSDRMRTGAASLCLTATLISAPACRDAEDRAFAGVQERGRVAMGVDQYTSSHVFEPLPDGGRIVLRRDVDDPPGVAQIREHMSHIARSFAAGDFRLPGFVHAGTVPGTSVMAAKRSLITYSADSLPRGGQVRIRTGDPEAVRAVHEFLAFQRHDHRAGASH